MKSILLVAGIGLALAGCSTTGHHTAWGKAGVSRVDYGTDIGMCTGIAAAQGAGNGANTAGGINGRNTTAQTDTGRGSASAGAGAAQSGGSNVPASGTYSGMANQDFVQRAATQQRAQEMAAKRAQADAFKGCLTERGYKEITLTPEQAAKLATFKLGSNEYHEYLYSLGTDAAVVAQQSAK